MPTRLTIATLVLATAALGSQLAHAQPRATAQAQWTKGNEGKLYAGLPFVLSIAVDGFDRSPPPSQPVVKIPGVTVTPTGVQPEVSQYIEEFNGRRRVQTRVRFSLRYRITAERAGTFRVPQVTVVQGKNKATARAGTFRVIELPTSKDMAIRVKLPDRSVWVGETFLVYIDWYVRQNRMPRHAFHIPLFELPDAFDISAPPAKGDDTKVGFKVGSRTIELPAAVTRENFGGRAHKRWRFKALVTPTKSGAFKLGPAQVVGNLGGMFRTQLYKAADSGRTLNVRALPTSGKPASFSNAVGSDFSLTVQTKRSFVRVGDPIELDITIRGNGQMQGLILPRLDVQGALAKKQFSVPAGNVVGKVIDKGAAKQFSVVVRLKTAVAGIPALPFSYFDPKAGIYKTVRSQKIALQVKGSTVVNSADVVNSSKRSKSSGHKGSAPTFMVKNSRLALSNPSRTLRKATSVGSLRPFLYALYGLPLLFLLFRVFQVRTREKRGEGSAMRKHRSALDAALKKAAREPASQSIADVESALRALAKTVGVSLREADDVLERLQNCGFDPKLKDSPVDGALIADIKGLGNGWTAKRKRVPTATVVATLFFVAATIGHVTTASAEKAADQAGIDAARKAYRQAMDQPDRDARRRGFAKAERLYRELVKTHDDRPELLTDWGNAALGAHELGIATLAYRRALRHDPNLSRASSNLAWVRDRAKSKPKTSKSAVDTLFFWHSSLSVPQRHLAAALAFALAMLLLTPWGWRTVLLRRLAVLPVLVSLAMIVSVVLEPDRSDEAVVVNDEVAIRSADSTGAPSVAKPLTAGIEATVVERRGQWTKIKLTDGVVGWVQTAAVELVARD